MSRTASPLACGITGSDGLRSATLIEQDRGALRPPALAWLRQSMAELEASPMTRKKSHKLMD